MRNASGWCAPAMRGTRIYPSKTRAEQNFSGIAGRTHGSGVSFLFDSTDQAGQLESVPNRGVALAATYYHRLSESRRRSTPANRFTCNESKVVRTAFRACGRGAWSPGPESERRRIHDRTKLSWKNAGSRKHINKGEHA